MTQKLNTVKIGREFEEEAYNILLTKFDEVIWLSKDKPYSPFDFKCKKDAIEYYIDAKFSRHGYKIVISDEQKKADYIILKNINGVKIIPNNDFIHFFSLNHKIPKPIGKTIILSGEKKIIKKWGNSLIISFNEDEQKIYDLKEGSIVDLKDMVVINKKRM